MSPVRRSSAVTRAALLALLALCAAGLVAVRSAHASVASPDMWLGANADTPSTVWADPANWSSGVPTNATDVVIPSGAANNAVLPMGATTTLESLTVSSGGVLKFSGASTLLTTGVFRLSGQLQTSTTGDTLNVTANGGTTVSGAGSAILALGANGSTLGQLHGAVTISGTSNLIGNVDFAPGSTVHVTAGASFNPVSAQPIVNDGAFTLDTGAQILGGGGSVLNNGTLTLNGGASGGASIGNNGTLTNSLSGTMTLGTGATVTKAGGAFANAGILHLGSTATVLVSGGTASSPGFSNTGTVTLDNGAAIGSGPSQYFGNTGAGTVTVLSSATNTVNVLATFSNAGTVTVQNGAAGLTIGTPNADTFAAGVLKQGTYALGGPLTLTGAVIIQIDGATVMLGQGFGASTTFNALASLQAGTFSVTGAGTVVADTSDLQLFHGTMTVDGGGAFTDSGANHSLSNPGDSTLVLGAGTVTANVNSGNLNVTAVTAPAVVVGSIATGSNAAMIAQGADLDVRAVGGGVGSGTYMVGSNLSGTGTVTGTLAQTGGMVTPGTVMFGNYSAIGTLHVNGAYVQTGGTLQLYYTAAGIANLDVTGQATLLPTGTTLSETGGTFSNGTANPLNGGTVTLPYGAFQNVPIVAATTGVSVTGGGNYVPVGLATPGGVTHGHQETSARFIVTPTGSRLGLTLIETAAPNPPTAVNLPASPTTGSTLTESFSPGADDQFGSGLVGTCAVFSTSSVATAADICGASAPSAATSVTSSALNNGTYFFHAVGKDLSGNYSTVLNSGPFVVNVPPANQAPTCAAGNLIDVPNATPATSQLTCTDPDPNTSLTYAVTSAPAHGAATVSATGLVTYTPTGTYSGTDPFVITASDGTLTATAVVAVNVRQAIAPTPVAPNVAPPPAGLPTTSLGAANSVSASATENVSSTTTGTGGSHGTLTVPAGALPAGTTVSTYSVTTANALAGTVPTNASYILAFAVSWVAPDGSSPNATKPLTFTVQDPGVKAGDTVFEVTPTGLRQVGSSLHDGTVTLTFQNDPIFVLSATPKLTLHGTGAVNKAGQLAVSLSCRVTTKCVGTATVSVTTKIKKGKKTVTVTTVLASGSIRNVHGTTQVFALRLTTAGKAALASGKRVKATLKLATKSGVTSTQSTTVKGAISDARSR